MGWLVPQPLRSAGTAVASAVKIARLLGEATKTPPRSGHGLRRVIVRHAGSTVCRSGRIAAASAAKTVRFDGLAIKIASVWELLGIRPGWGRES